MGLLSSPGEYLDCLGECRHLALKPADTLRKLGGAVAG